MGSYNEGSYNQLFLQPEVVTTMGLTTRVLIRRDSYNEGFLQLVSYNQGFYNLGFLQPGVLQHATKECLNYWKA